MLKLTSALKGYDIQGRDGIMGTLHDFLFDDEQWTTRYLVVDTGGWLSDRQVLLSPHTIASVNESKKRIVLELTKQQIEDSPSLASNQPISRQFEDSHSNYYGWPTYWETSDIMSISPLFGIPPGNASASILSQDNTAFTKDINHQATTDIRHELLWRESRNTHLRSANEVSGYTLIADDAEVGRVKDFIIDENSWAFRYLIIATGSWWSGKMGLISPQWVSDIRWSDAQVYVHMNRAIIKVAPTYANLDSVTRAYEEKLHHHYQRHGYWINEVDRHTQPI